MRSTTLKVTAALLVWCLICGVAGCSRPVLPPAPPPAPGPAPGQPLPPPRSSQQASSLAQASTLEATAEAIRAVIGGSLSLRLADDPGPPSRAVSVSPEDIVALAYLEQGAHATPVYSLVEFLAAAGVTLESEASPLTSAQLLPYLQSYVDWSYANPHDDRALLGVMLATAPEAAGPPASAPRFTAETLLSPTAALMLLADILIGVPPESLITATPARGRIAHAAPSISDRVLGMVFRTRAILVREGGSPYMHALLGIYALGSRFAVRLLVDEGYDLKRSEAGALQWSATRTDLKRMAVAKSVTLDRYLRETMLVTVTALLPTRESSFIQSGAVQTGGMILEQLPVRYDFRLLSAATLGLAEPLCEDADLRLLFPAQAELTDSPEMRLQLVPQWAPAPYRATLEGNMPLPVMIRASLLQNSEPQPAVLLVSAKISWPDLESALSQNADITSVLGLSLDELRSMYADLLDEIAFPPWMCTVLMRPSTLPELDVDPELQAVAVGEECKFVVTETEDVLRALLAGMAYEYEWQVYAVDESGSSRLHGEPVRKRSTWHRRGEVDQGSSDTGPAHAFRVSFTEQGSYEVTATLRVWSDPNGLDSQGTMERLAAGSARVEIRPPEPGTIRISVTTNPPLAEAGTAVAITAAPIGDFAGLPEAVIWRWEFGDGSSPQEARPQALHTIEGGPVAYRISHTFQQPGEYSITITVMDSQSRAVVATAEYDLTVLSDLAVIGRTTALRAMLEAWCNHDWYSYEGSVQQTSAKGFYQRKGLVTEAGALSWQGTTFTATFAGRMGPAAPMTVYNIGTSSDADYTVRVTGAVAEDARSLAELIISWEAIDPKYGATLRESLTLRGVPLKKVSFGEGVEFLAWIQGETVAQYVAGYEFVKLETATGRTSEKFTGFDWDRGSHHPGIELQFRVEPPPGGWRSRM